VEPLGHAKLPGGGQTFSLYCALEKATIEVTGNFQHRGAAMQESRFVIDEMAPNRNYPPPDGL